MLVSISMKIKACFRLVCYFFPFFNFLPFYSQKALLLVHDFPQPTVKFHNFPGLEMEIINSITFQVFHDPYEPCCSKQNFHFTLARFISLIVIVSPTENGCDSIATTLKKTNMLPIYSKSMDLAG